MAILEVSNIGKSFGTSEVLKDISFSLEEGQAMAIIGSSGSGKTTLLRCLNFLETPDAGVISVKGEKLFDAAAGDSGKDEDIRKKRLHFGLVFQGFNLFPQYTALQNVALAGELLAREQSDYKQRAKDIKAALTANAAALLERMGLADKAGLYPHQLSGGQQQRVALARSLVKRPQLLLLDEPLGALDKKLREETQIELVNIIKDVGVTCVMVTHDQEEAMTMADRIGVMDEGVLLQVDVPNELYETPNSRFVADFIGNVNLMEGVVVDDQPSSVTIECADCVHYVGHGITGHVGLPVTVALRPEKIYLSREEPEGEHNRVQGVVEEMSYFGSYSVYFLRLPSGAKLKVSEENDLRLRESKPTWDDTVWASWPPSAQVVLTH